MYFDPGIGSLIIQAILAGLAVIGGYFGLVKNKFKKKKNSDELTQNDKEKNEETDDEL